MKKGFFHRVSQLTPTKFWINNVTREQARQAIDAGAVGCTQNPAYTWKMLSDKDEAEYVKSKLDAILEKEPDDNLTLVKLQRDLIGEIALIFRPIYEKSDGKYGFVSIQGDPFSEDIESIVKFARFNREAGENIMVKVPATEEGINAIKILASENIPLNATEIMAVRQAIDVCDAYMEGIAGIKNPAPLYYSHIAGIFDDHLKNVVERERIDITEDVLWQAGICVAKKIYQIIKEREYPVHYIGGGARGLHHFTEMVGADASITINWAGTADKLIEMNPMVVQHFLHPTPHSVLDELVDKLEDFRRAYFINEITAEEYEEFGPVVLFRTSFEEAWKNALGFIKVRKAERM